MATHLFCTNLSVDGLPVFLVLLSSVYYSFFFLLSIQFERLKSFFWRPRKWDSLPVYIRRKKIIFHVSIKSVSNIVNAGCSTLKIITMVIDDDDDDDAG